MRSKNVFRFITILIALTLALSVFPVYSPEVYGPREDNLLVKIFYDPTTENWALDKGEIDINDWPLLKEWVDRWSKEPDKFVLRDYSEIGQMEFDINNQQWPTGCPGTFDPTNDDCIKAREFRRALAHLANKDKIISDILKGLGYRVDTPMPYPALAGWTDYASWEAEGLIRKYDPAEAERILDAAGFADIDGNGIRNDPKTGADMAPLKFYIRIDDPNRRAAGLMLAEDMETVGIPVDAIVTEKTVCYDQVMVVYDYNIYTGGWSLTRDPDFLFDLYHSSMYWGPDEGWSLNYPGFLNDEYDAAAEKAKYAITAEEAMEGALEAQEIYLDNVPVIQLWASAAVNAYRTGWTGVVNELGFGIANNIYTWITMTNPATDTIRWGFKSDIEELNMITSEWLWDHYALELVYEPLLMENPYNLAEDLPWIAESWELGTWEGGQKLTWHLRDDVVWHDGTPLTATDVAFTIDFNQACGSGVAWVYVNVADVNRTNIVDPYTLEVYFNVESWLALHWIGGLPIVPKHIWETITDAEGDTWWIGDYPDGQVNPDWDSSSVREFEPWETPNGMIGTSAWVFEDWTPGETVLFSANRDWFMTADEVEAILFDAFHRVGDVNYDGVIDITDPSIIARALGTTPSSPHGTGWDQWNPDADLNGDDVVDLIDLFLVGLNFGKVTG